MPSLLTDKVTEFDDNDDMVDENNETDFKMFIQEGHQAEAKKGINLPYRGFL